MIAALFTDRVFADKFEFSVVTVLDSIRNSIEDFAGETFGDFLDGIDLGPLLISVDRAFHQADFCAKVFDGLEGALAEPSSLGRAAED